MTDTMIHIRKVVLGLSQAEMAGITKVSQGTVSKWEAGVLVPDKDEMARIRAYARKMKVDWDDRWFFEVPKA